MEIESMKQAIEKAVISCNARVIIWDTISDAMDALTVEEQAQVMKWCKSLVAMYNCSLILIAHQKKPTAGAKARYPWKPIARNSGLWMNKVF